MQLAWGLPRIYVVQGQSLLRPQLRVNRRQTARQLEAKSVQIRKFILRIAGKRVGQSSPALDSILGQPKQSFDQKQSLRFDPERPVDAHFRFAVKTTPTPNESEPRLLLHIEASSARATHSLQISSRLTKRLVRYDPPNFASKRLLLESATDRRQLHPTPSKFRGSILKSNQSQQKGTQRTANKGFQQLHLPLHQTFGGGSSFPRAVPG